MPPVRFSDYGMTTPCVAERTLEAFAPARRFRSAAARLGTNRIADVVYVVLFLQRGLHATAVQYLVFLALAIKGYVDWRRSMRDAAAPAAFQAA